MPPNNSVRDDRSEHLPSNKCTCMNCRKTFSKESHLQKHKSNHSQRKIQNCDICDFFTFRSYTLTLHRFTHTGEKPFKCSLCEKGFATPSTLKNHSFIHVDKLENGQVYNCTLCAKLNLPVQINWDTTRHQPTQKWNCTCVTFVNSQVIRKTTWPDTI